MLNIKANAVTLLATWVTTKEEAAKELACRVHSVEVSELGECVCLAPR